MPIIQNYYPKNANYGINLLFCGSEDCPSGYIFGPAKRTNYLLHYVASGTGRYWVDDKEYLLKKGQFFVIFPGDITSYAADTNDPWTYYWIGFDGIDTDDMLLHLNINRQNHVSRSSNPEDSLTIFQGILTHGPAYLANPLKRNAQIANLFASLAPEEVLHEHLTADTTRQALAFIHNNYQYDVRISDLAKTVNLERTWLYRRFQQEMGKSPKAYLTEYRLKKAKDYLRNSHLTLTEIALSCGFISSSAFHKHFKKAFGITPKAYRHKEQ